jgi:hypothetical protein
MRFVCFHLASFLALGIKITERIVEQHVVVLSLALFLAFFSLLPSWW